MDVGRIILAMLLLAFTISCSNKDTKQDIKDPVKTEEGIGVYVYLDRARVLHTKNGCKAVFKEHNMQEVRPVKPTDLKMENLKRVCSQCVTEHQLIELEGLIEAELDARALESDTIAAEYDPDTDDPYNSY